MMQRCTDEDVIRMARDKFPVDRPMTRRTEEERSLVHDLCDRLQARIDAGKPPVRNWEGVWGEFDARQRQHSAQG
jgi:hypothetical protein